MFPWSVIPTAGCPSAAAVAMTSATRAAPSSIEYSVWRCRCANELFTVPVLTPVRFSTGSGLPCGELQACNSEPTPGTCPPQANARAFGGSGSAAAGEERDQHLGAGERSVGRDETGFSGEGGVEEGHRVPGGEGDAADPAAGGRRSDRGEPARAAGLGSAPP